MPLRSRSAKAAERRSKSPGAVHWVCSPSLWSQTSHYCVDLSAEFVVLEAALDTVSGGFADFVERRETWEYQFACLLTYGDDVGLTEHRC